MNGASDLALIRGKVRTQHLDDHKKNLALMGEHEVVVVHVRHGDRPRRLGIQRNMFLFRIRAKGNVKALLTLGAIELEVIAQLASDGNDT